MRDHSLSSARSVAGGDGVNELGVDIYPRGQIGSLVRRGCCVGVTWEPNGLFHRAEVDAPGEFVRRDLGDAGVQLPVLPQECLASRRIGSHAANDRLQSINVFDGAVTGSVSVDEFFKCVTNGESVRDAGSILTGGEECVPQSHHMPGLRNEQAASAARSHVDRAPFGQQSSSLADRGPPQTRLLA